MTKLALIGVLCGVALVIWLSNKFTCSFREERTILDHLRNIHF